MPSRPRHRLFAGFRHHRPEHPARAVILTSGSVLLALCATLLPSPALTPVAQAASAPWADTKAPKQRTGTAAGRKHEVGAARTDANGRNKIDPEDLKTAKDALPLQQTGPGFTPIEPKAKTRKLNPVTTGGTGASAGFDAKRSVELPGERTATSKEFRNPDGTRTTRAYTEPVHYKDASATWREIDTSLVPVGEAKGAPEAAKGDGSRLAAASDNTGLTLASRGDDPALAALKVDGGRHEVGFGLAGASGAAAEVHGDAAHYEDIRHDSDVVLQAVHEAVKETIVLNTPDAPREWRDPLPGLRRVGPPDLRHAQGAGRHGHGLGRLRLRRGLSPDG